MVAEEVFWRTEMVASEVCQPTVYWYTALNFKGTLFQLVSLCRVTIFQKGVA
jgi:hypothetical protein